MRFSLVLPTIRRTDELQRFLVSLHNQTHRDFELIVVDQNPDARLVPILAPYKAEFPVLHLRSEKKGQSRARNLGFQHATGDIVAFPDDDCQYPPDLLASVERFFVSNFGVDGLTGRSIDEDGKTSNGRFATRAGIINKYNVWSHGISYTIFLRRNRIQEVRFNEKLGPGAGTRWGASDETDYLLQLLERKLALYYDPRVCVIHPEPRNPGTYKHLKRRAYTYSCGMGYVLKSHGYPLWYVLYYCARPVGGMLLALGRGKTAKASYHWAVFRGRLAGWVGS